MWKLRAFGLKIGTFPRLLVVVSYPCRIYHGLVAGMWHLKRSSITSAWPTQKVSMGLVVNFKIMQQPTNLVTFFQIRECSQDYKHRASLIFYYSYQYCFYYYCYWFPVSFQTWSSSIYRESSNFLSFLKILSFSLALSER